MKNTYGEYAKLGIKVGEHGELSSPVLVNAFTGTMHRIEDSGSVSCVHCRIFLPTRSNKAEEIRLCAAHYAIMSFASKIHYSACRVCSRQS